MVMKPIINHSCQSVQSDQYRAVKRKMGDGDNLHFLNKETSLSMINPLYSQKTHITILFLV